MCYKKICVNMGDWYKKIIHKIGFYVLFPYYISTGIISLKYWGFRSKIFVGDK